MKKIENKKSHKLRSKSALNKNNKNTNSDLRKQAQKFKIIKKKKKTNNNNNKQPFKTEFSSKSLIHMIFTNQTHKPSKQTNLQQTHKPIFS